MKALVKLSREPGLVLQDMPIPKIGPNDVLVKIKKTSICGTDLHIYHWDQWAEKNVPLPLIIGHEFIGEIVEVGQEVKAIKIGDRVSGENHISCGFCRNCRAGRLHICRKEASIGVNLPGCFAEYLVIPGLNAYPVPPAISDNIAAILNPLGNAVHTTLSFCLVGEDVLITGAGPVGIMSAAIARHVGARHVVITDVNEYRLQLAKKMGATLAINPNETSLKDAMNLLKMREGFDVGLEVSGNANAFSSMLAHMNQGGKVSLLGFLPEDTRIDWNHIIMKGLCLKGIYGREMYETWYKMITMLESGLDISGIITHEFQVADYEKVFETALSGRSGKIIINW